MESFFGPVQLFQFTQLELFMTLLVFIWTGFVRSGLGFGGAALGLPLMLLIFDQPLFWLPVIGTHLLFFTSLTLRTRLKNVDWGSLKSTLWFILPTKLIGVFGLLNLPNNWLIVIIYSITLFYALLWIMDWSIKSKSGWSDKVLLLIGGYVSGTSLTGAPLLVAVYMNHVVKDKLRNTLFVLWFILVSIKMSTFAAVGVDLHSASAVLLIPVAAIGHIIGLKTHDYILQNDKLFRRVIGVVLVLICILGFQQLIMD